MKRPKKVYRLVVVAYPEGSDEPDWEPEDWDPGHWNGDPDNEPGGFYWPALRSYLSKGAVERRAWLFQKYGATVAIEESEPIAWTGVQTVVRPDPRPPVTPYPTPAILPTGSPF